MSVERPAEIASIGQESIERAVTASPADSMSRTPLVSVVTIFLNEGRFLGDAVESVLAQTWRRWELLLVDDGSTDESTHLARRYAARHPDRIRYFEHRGHCTCGKSVSRNLGIREARGEYLAFLDGDDVFLPEKLERQTLILESQPTAAMVYGPTLYWFDWTDGPASRRDFVGRVGVEANRLFAPPELVRLFLRDGGTVPCICALLVRRRVAIHDGGFDERIHHMFEDQVFLAKVCARFPVFVESGCWDKYRQHAHSTSQQAIASGVYHPSTPNPSRRAFLEWLESYLRDRGLRDRELNKLVRRALRPYRHPWLYHASALAERVRRRLTSAISLRRRGPR